MGISGWVFANDATIKAFKFPQPLPSEKQFDPNFAEQQEEKPKGMKPLEVKQVPPSGKNAKAKGGLQLIFDVRNPSFRPDFPQIRDYIYQVDQKKQSSVFSPGTVEIDWTNGVIVIPDLVPKDDVMSLAIMQLKNKLQQLGYANTAGIGSIVTELTGIKPKEAYNETRNEMLAQPRTHAKTQGAIKANLKPQGPKLASRFHGLAQELGIDPTQPMSSEQYEQILSRAYGGKPAPEQLDPQTGKPIPSGIPYGPDNWHGPFGSRTTPHQRKAQAEGMRFVASRTASVLADEPGSGKTAQAIVGADAVREDGQKVLVVTPGVLLQENWVGDDAKGPMFFCGHDRNQVAVISNSQDYEAAMADPSKIWIVLRDTTLQQTGGDMQKLVQGISAASKQKKFSSLIIDEIQRYKNSDSIRFEQMQNAISPYDIDHRIGLTGTPADNTPDDIFSQMALLRHGQLYTNDGKRNWTQVQGVVGFSRQFLGGEELSTGIQLTDDEKKKSPEEQEQIIATKWAHKASGVLQWVQQLDKNKKEDILDLFTSTYLRRNKEDIRPEIAQEAPLDNTGKIEVPADPQIPFRRDIKTLEKIANKKAEATAEHAKALLLANPQQKIFIASRFISSANLIAKLINEKMGAKGIAVAVTSKFAAPLMHPSGPDGRVGPKMNDEEARAHVAEEFRKDNGRLNHHDDVLRAVVYTLDLGAVGLNFSNATEAIINDMAWNPSTNLQAEYRVHRIDSKKPVKINYTMMKGTYDEEMYKRVNKKKEINKGMSDLMRAAQQEKDPKARLALANKFVDDAIENILIDAGLSPKQQRWFDDNLQKAFQGQPVETFEQMVRREKQAENQLLFDNMPQWTHLPTSMGIADQYRAAALETLEDHFGEEWTRLPPEVLKPFLHQAFARQEQVAA